MLNPNPELLKILAQLEVTNNNAMGTDLNAIAQYAMQTDYASTPKIPSSLDGALGNNFNNLNPQEADRKGWAFDPTQDEASMAMALTTLNEDYKRGDINYDEYQQLYSQYNGDPDDMLEENLRGNKNQLGIEEISSLLSNNYAPSLGTSAYNIGRFGGMDKGTKGRGLGMAASIGDFTLGAARGILGGLGQAKENARVQEYYEENKKPYNKYSAVSQTSNTNTTGGLAGFRDGGEILREIYQQQTELDPRYREGEYIEFEYGGEIKKGKIKKVEGGKIYL